MHRRESAGHNQRDLPVPKHQAPEAISTEANLGKNSLTGQKFGSEADNEAHHCQSTIPLLSEGGEAEFCVVHRKESRLGPL